MPLLRREYSVRGRGRRGRRQEWRVRIGRDQFAGPESVDPGVGTSPRLFGPERRGPVAAGSQDYRIVRTSRCPVCSRVSSETALLVLSKKRWPGRGYEVKEAYLDAGGARPALAAGLLVRGYPPWECPTCGTPLLVELSKINARALSELSHRGEAVRFDDLPWE